MPDPHTMMLDADNASTSIPVSSRKRRASGDFAAPQLKVVSTLCPASYVPGVSYRRPIGEPIYGKDLKLTMVERLDVRSNLRNITNSFYEKCAISVNFLNFEDLTKMVYAAGCGEFSRILLFDEVQGLVLSAFLVAMNGRGNLHLLHAGMNPATHGALNFVQFRNDVSSVISLVKLSRNVPDTQKFSDDCMDCDNGTEKPVPVHQTVRLNYEGPPLDAVVLAPTSISAFELIMRVYPAVKEGGSIVVFTTDSEDLYIMQAFLMEKGAVNIVVDQKEIPALYRTRRADTAYLLTCNTPMNPPSALDTDLYRS